MTKRLDVELTRENYQRLEKRTNYLGSTRTNAILLSFFIYNDLELTEIQVTEQLDRISSDSESEKIYFKILPYMLDQFKNKKMYLYSLNNYITAYLNILLEDKEIDWKESEQQQKKISSAYYLDETLANWLASFSDQTGISQSTFLNYSFMHSIPDNLYTTESKDKIRKGVRLTLASLDYIKKQKNLERSAIIEAHIKEIQHLAEVRAY